MVQHGHGMSELIIYQTDDGLTRVQFRAEDGSLWLTQLEIADLFGGTVANVNIHIRNILKEGELLADSVIKEDLITAADGKRYRTKLYRLDMILAADAEDMKVLEAVEKRVKETKK